MRELASVTNWSFECKLHACVNAKHTFLALFDLPFATNSLVCSCSGRVDCQVTVNPRGEHGAYAWFVNGQKDPCGIDVPKFVVVVAKCLLLPTTTAPIRLPVSTGITPSHVTNSSRNVSVAQAQLHAELDS